MDRSWVSEDGSSGLQLINVMGDHCRGWGAMINSYSSGNAYHVQVWKGRTDTSQGLVNLYT